MAKYSIKPTLCGTFGIEASPIDVLFTIKNAKKGKSTAKTSLEERFKTTLRMKTKKFVVLP